MAGRKWGSVSFVHNFVVSGISHGSKRRVINSTIILMLTTTKVHSYAPKVMKDIANQQCHNLKTAEQNYLFTDLQTRAGETSSKIQEMKRRKPKDMKKVFKEDLEHDYTDMAIVRKKLKSNFPLDVFIRKRKMQFLIFLGVKSRRAVEMIRSLMSQLTMK